MIKVVFPAGVLLVALAVIFIELAARFVTNWLYTIYTSLRSSKVDRLRYQELKEEILCLKRKAGSLNSPETFVQFAKTNRKINKLTREYDALAEIVVAPPFDVNRMVLQYGLKALWYAALVGPFVYEEKVFFELPTPLWPFPLSSFPPFRLLHGAVGVLPWLIICNCVVVRAIPLVSSWR